MSELWQALHDVTERGETFRGRLGVDGVLSTVRMQYEGQGVMEIRGLAVDMPAYLRFDEKGVKLRLDGDYEKNEGEEALNIYRVFDPITVFRSLIDPEGKPEEQTLRWAATFYPQLMYKDFPVVSTLAEWMGKQVGEGKSFLESEKVSFVVESEKVLEMAFRTSRFLVRN